MTLEALADTKPPGKRGWVGIPTAPEELKSIQEQRDVATWIRSFPRSQHSEEFPECAAPRAALANSMGDSRELVRIQPLHIPRDSPFPRHGDGEGAEEIPDLPGFNPGKEPGARKGRKRGEEEAEGAVFGRKIGWNVRPWSFTGGQDPPRIRFRGNFSILGMFGRREAPESLSAHNLIKARR